MSALPPDAVERFRVDFTTALGRPVDQERVAIAVSGGPDSMALLALAAAAFPRQVIAATVDHGLRIEAADEARLVAAWCAGQEVAHAILQLKQPLARGGVQANARAARYDLLARWALEQGAPILATAHHADDQAETFLMRAVRGAGPSGLASIRASRPLAVRDGHRGYPKGGVVAVYDERWVTLVRPLLSWRRVALRDLAQRGAIPFVDDPSNIDRQFERVRVRQLLADTPWLDAAHLAHSARHAAEAAAAIDDFSGWLWRTRRVAPVGVDDPDFEVWLDMADLPRELTRRLARAAISDVRLINGITRPAFDPATNIEPLLDALAQGKSATHGAVMVSATRDIWRFREAPPRRSL